MAKKTKNKDIEKAALPKSKPDVINKDIMDMVDFKNYEKEKGELHPKDPRAGDNMDTGKAFYEEGDKTLESEIERLTKLAKERKKFLGKEINAAKGGSMTKQMEMFEEGGLKDEGGTVDEASGNDVPIGSTKEEVRDDIPAQLSEGEFVFPADVVRFIGLEKLMQMRQKAKMGLKKMEDMGQMGNSEEATIPDDMPFSIDDIDMEEEDTNSNFNRGGVVKMAIGGTTPTTENTSQNTNVTMNESNLNPKQTSVPIRTDLNPITQQRTTTQQKPLNIRQASVPTRGQVTNIPSSADFLKKKSSEPVNAVNFLDAAPKDIGSRYTGKFTSQADAINKTKKELDDILSINPYSDNNEDGMESKGIAQAGINYADTDRFALPDNARDALNNFSKSQLSMFSMFNPLSSGIAKIGSAVSMVAGDILGKPSLGSGVFMDAEKGKAEAIAFNTAMIDIQRDFGIPVGTPMQNWDKKAQEQIGIRGQYALNTGTALHNARYNLPFDSSLIGEDKSFIEKAQAAFNNLLGKEKENNIKDFMGTEIVDVTNKAAMEKIDKNYNLDRAYYDIISKQTLAKIATEKLAAEEGGITGFGFEDSSTVGDLTEAGFNGNTRDEIAANGGSIGIRYNDNGQAYSENQNGTFTHTDGTTVNFTDSKGNPGNAPTTPKPSPPPAPPPPVYTPPPSYSDNNDNGGNDGTDGGYGGSDNTTDYGGT